MNTNTLIIGENIMKKRNTFNKLLKKIIASQALATNHCILVGLFNCEENNEMIIKEIKQLVKAQK